MKVKLKDIVECLELAGFDTDYYYSVKDEGILYLSEGLVDGVWDRERYKEIRENEEDYIHLPDQYAINEYEIMRDFIYELPEGKKQDQLACAIQGKGAFRRFKDKLFDLNLEDQWYAFKQKTLEKIAREWCEDNEIEIEE